MSALSHRFVEFWKSLRKHCDTEGSPHDRPTRRSGGSLNHDMMRVVWFHAFIRILSVFVVSTEFVPDEAWQSTEVAHHLVSGNGYLTWEWKYGLRSYIYPVLLSIPIRLLGLVGMDTPQAIILTTRLAHALLLFTGEQAFFRFNITKYGYKSAKWGLGAMIFCWFLFFCGCRSLTNVTELALNMIALKHFHKRSFIEFTGILALNFVIRPTAVIYWIVFIPSVCGRITTLPYQMVGSFVVGSSVLLLNLLVDYLYYGRFVLPWWNFFMFNFMEGKSAVFGTHPLLWYFYSGIPSIIGFSAPIVYLGMALKLRRYMHEFIIMGLFLGVYSVVPHKEIRFLLPIVPHLCMILGDVWEAIIYLATHVYPVLKRYAWTAFLCTISANVVAALFFSNFHQAGIYPASTFIHEATKTEKDAKIWIMMPCYSVPVQTYIHNPTAQIEFFTCSPLGLEYDSPNPQLGDFEDVDLLAFTESKLSTNVTNAPDYVMLYSTATAEVKSFMEQNFNLTYEVCSSHYHTLFAFDSVGEHVDVLCMNSQEQELRKRKESTPPWQIVSL